jgi:hypothetical protein
MAGTELDVMVLALAVSPDFMLNTAIGRKRCLFDPRIVDG